MARPLQHDPTALIFGLPAARTANIVANNAPSGSEHSDAIISVPLEEPHGMVDRDGLEQVRDQLWAEAVHRYESGDGE